MLSDSGGGITRLQRVIVNQKKTDKIGNHRALLLLRGSEWWFRLAESVFLCGKKKGIWGSYGYRMKPVGISLPAVMATAESSLVDFQFELYV